ncbi:hypothetical protein BD779DRAFT_166815 [Infundibulicybe gibba]|nr:hypothetical protein BD779DRAFT_166815 [Infundibulicybe gibba]
MCMWQILGVNHVIASSERTRRCFYDPPRCCISYHLTTSCNTSVQVVRACIHARTRQVSASRTAVCLCLHMQWCAQTSVTAVYLQYIPMCPGSRMTGARPSRQPPPAAKGESLCRWAAMDNTIMTGDYLYIARGWAGVGNWECADDEKRRTFGGSYLHVFGLCSDLFSSRRTDN